MLRKLSYLFPVVLLFNTFVYASPAQSVLSLGVAGVATPQPDTLAVAAPLARPPPPHTPPHPAGGGVKAPHHPVAHRHSANISAVKRKHNSRTRQRGRSSRL